MYYSDGREMYKRASCTCRVVVLQKNYLLLLRRSRCRCLSSLFSLPWLILSFCDLVLALLHYVSRTVPSLVSIFALKHESSDQLTFCIVMWFGTEVI